MPEDCAIEDIEPVTLAVTETFVKRNEIPNVITRYFDVVYKWIGDAPVKQTGHNYALYDQFCPVGMRMRVGFPVSAPFENGDRVTCFEMPAGKAVHARHRGAYSGLFEAYQRLNAWCDARSISTAGLNWEVYGDWYDDASKLVTDVYIRIDAAESATKG